MRTNQIKLDNWKQWSDFGATIEKDISAETSGSKTLQTETGYFIINL